MATVHRIKTPAGKLLPTYYAFFRVPTANGGTKQVKRSTEFTNKAQALRAARDFEKDAKAEAGAGDGTASEILARVREAGQLALKGRLNPAEGRRLIGEIMKLSGDDTGGNFTLREWVADWFKEKEETVKPSTAQLYRATTAQFIDFVGDKADAPLDSISTPQVRAYRDSIRKGRTAKTANHKLKVLRSLFGDAVKVSALLHNPAAPIKPLEESDSVPREPFTTAEVGKLAKAATSPDWKGVILLGALTGLRLTDATRLTAGNLDMERGVISLTPRKTERKGTTVEIPLHPDLVEFFEGHEIPPFAKSALFPSLTGLESGGRDGLSDQFKKIMETAKVERGIARAKGEGVARTTAARSFHSLRHTFTSWLAKADVPEEVRMKMTGHTESKTHQKYTHQELSTLRAGVDRIPRIEKA
jgi:integrase